MAQRILIVDPDRATSRRLIGWLEADNRLVQVVPTAAEALEQLAEDSYSLIITEINLPDRDGLELIEEVRKLESPAKVLVLTGQDRIWRVVEAMKLGVFDYLEKPAQASQLTHLVDQALHDQRLLDEVARLREHLQQHDSFHNLIGRSSAMRSVFATVSRIASTPNSVLITGETGTGKELLAQAIHMADATRTGPLVTVNCMALPESLLESELFGHEAGAFTSADKLRRGRFEQAFGGTLFLDEIGEIPLNMQAKLLRVLQEGYFERVGGNTSIASSARILSATNIRLEEAVEAGTFRRDLYYRLNVVSIECPPLRDRVEDIPLLVDHFLKGLRLRGLPFQKRFGSSAMAQLKRYPWPGNVRELEHLVEQMAVTTSEESIEAQHLPEHIAASETETPLSLDFDPERPLGQITEELTSKIERAYLIRVLEKYRGRVGRCAEHSGLSRRSISDKLRRYQIDKSQFKASLEKSDSQSAQAG